MALGFGSRAPDGRVKHARVYCTQYGYWWSLTPASFKRMLQAGARGEGYNLDDYGAEIKSPPPRGKNHVLAFTPLDWNAEQCQDLLDQMERCEYPFTWMRGC